MIAEDFSHSLGKLNGTGLRAWEEQFRRPPGQDYLSGAVHCLAIWAVAPSLILSIVALLTIKHDRIGS